MMMSLGDGGSVVALCAILLWLGLLAVNDVRSRLISQRNVEDGIRDRLLRSRIRFGSVQARNWAVGASRRQSEAHKLEVDAQISILAAPGTMTPSLTI